MSVRVHFVTRETRKDSLREAQSAAFRRLFARAAVARRLLSRAPMGKAALRRQQENVDLDLAMTYSAYREIEMVPRNSLENVSQAILGLADDPMPEGAVMLEDAKGCYYLAVDGWYILYHLSDRMDALTVLGVLDGPEHTVH